MDRPLPNAVLAHREFVYAICLGVLKHPQDAEDACQEVLIEASREIGALRNPERFRSWLSQLARHTALDARRRRAMRSAYEPSTIMAQPPDAIELREALGRLEDEERDLVVAHYLEGRSLDELGERRGCSAVAVWKRIRRARERLKRWLAPAVIAMRFPERSRTPPVLLFIAEVALVVLPVLILVMGAAAKRQGAASAPRSRGPAAMTVLQPAIEPPKRAEPASRGREVRAPDPYPWELPPRGWPEPARQAWTLLNREVTLNCGSNSLADVLAELGLQTGGVIILDPNTASPNLTVFRVQRLSGRLALKLAISQQGLEYELQEDGVVFVSNNERLARRLDDEACHVEQELLRVARVRDYFAQGWDGLDVRSPRMVEAATRLDCSIAGPVTTSLTFQDAVDRLNAKIAVDYRLLDERKDLQAERKHSLSAMSRVRTHLERLCEEAGVGYSIDREGHVVIRSADRASQERLSEEDDWRRTREVLGKLDRPFPGEEALDPPTFSRRLEKASGVRVIPSQEVWESGRLILPPAGKSCREALDALRSQTGFRWGVYGEGVYLVH